MSKHISVMEGLLRSKARRMLLTIAFTFLFGVAGYGILTRFRYSYPGNAKVNGFFFLWAILCLALAVWTCVEWTKKSGTNLSNLYGRLRISERTVFFLDFVCNVLVFAVFWAAQILTLYLLTKFTDSKYVYCNIQANHYSTVRYFILPMFGHTYAWFRHILIVLICAVNCATISCYERRKNAESLCVQIVAGFVLGAYFLEYVLNAYETGDVLIGLVDLWAVTASAIEFFVAFKGCGNGRSRGISEQMPDSFETSRRIAEEGEE